jgi:pilus assembly protein CpaF
VPDDLAEGVGGGRVRAQHLHLGLGASDILVNASNRVFIERNGVLELTKVQFKDDRHLLQVIDRIVSAVGRRIDESSPMVDARLPDGSRVNAIIPPLAIDGPHMSIRKFRRDTLSARTWSGTGR